MPLIQRWIVSRCLPNLSAMRVFGILCSCNSQHRVISVLSCMSMILHGLSDFYGNIAPLFPPPLWGIKAGNLRDTRSTDQRLSFTLFATLSVMPSTDFNSSTVARLMPATEPNLLTRARFRLAPKPGIPSR